MDARNFDLRRPCGTHARGPTRYRRRELERVAKAYGIPTAHLLSLDSLCVTLTQAVAGEGTIAEVTAAEVISRARAGEVPVPAAIPLRTMPEFTVTAREMAAMRTSPLAIRAIVARGTEMLRRSEDTHRQLLGAMAVLTVTESEDAETYLVHVADPEEFVPGFGADRVLAALTAFRRKVDRLRGADEGETDAEYLDFFRYGAKNREGRTAEDFVAEGKNASLEDALYALPLPSVAKKVVPAYRDGRVGGISYIGEAALRQLMDDPPPVLLAVVRTKYPQSAEVVIHQRVWRALLGIPLLALPAPLSTRERQLMHFLEHGTVARDGEGDGEGSSGAEAMLDRFAAQ